VLRLIPCVCMLSPLPRQDRETKSLITNTSTSAFPKLRVGRLLHYGFRGLLSVVGPGNGAVRRRSSLAGALRFL
jgi:hypothetical protein